MKDLVWRIWRLLRFGLGMVGLALLAAFLWVFREYHRDPMPLLDRGAITLRLARQVRKPFLTATGERRVIWELDLVGDVEGPLRASVSLPEGEEGPFPVVVILGGLEVGRQSLLYVDTHGRNALVACEYPRSSDYW